MFESGEERMQFERVEALARETPTSVICEAWGASRHYVELCKLRVREMTIEEAGDLADLHGLKLPDILAV